MEQKEYTVFKEYLQNLQVRQKWTQQRRNLIEGDFVMLLITMQQDEMGHGQSGDNLSVRSIAVVTSCGSALERPINKLVFLMHQSIETPTSPSRAKVGDSGGMNALLNKIVAQGGGVIDNYSTATLKRWGQPGEFDTATKKLVGKTNIEGTHSWSWLPIRGLNYT